jgi:hypothetical protein
MSDLGFIEGFESIAPKKEPGCLAAFYLRYSTFVWDYCR